MILPKKDQVKLVARYYYYTYNNARLWGLIVLIPLLITLGILIRVYQVRKTKRNAQIITQVPMPEQQPTSQICYTPNQPAAHYDGYRVQDYPTEPAPAYVPPAFPPKGGHTVYDENYGHPNRHPPPSI